MASLARTYSDEKLNGVIYTPAFIVQKILDDIGYTVFSKEKPSILGKTIIDPACGDGRFLVEAAKRIIDCSPKKHLKENLECIHGWDIDSNAVQECIENLNGLVSIPIDWNIKQTNSIKHYHKQSLFLPDNGAEKFDYIAGNPPYIRIQHLDIEQRQYIQQHYSFCKSGATDIYIAFYELCLSLLTENGICGLITPNTFLHTETARAMRQYFAANGNLLQITNYGDRQLFNGATTYSAITVFNKGSNSHFVYQKAVGENNDNYEARNIAFSELQEPFWQLSISKEPDTIVSGNKKLKDVCKIHVGITTLCDSAYIFPLENGGTAAGSQYVNVKTKLRGTVKLEKAILKPIIKGSKLKHSQQPITEYVLFPYKKQNGKHTIIPEDELQDKYPFAYRYLLSVKPELDKRDNGRTNPAAWYAFGRSQGLDTSFGAKIIFSPMNHKPNFVYYANPDCTFYSGYCIQFDGDMNELLPQLNSDRMQEFVASSSRDFRGGWKAYNKKIIENYEVKL
ncbi:MAG: N-6 DNA methylase [Planctomycetaceae bacterium]|jgi:methylase of polypeptide subunit release factors|nr:N-6 DNA methylase [Planctomycetaceae bacterium]